MAQAKGPLYAFLRQRGVSETSLSRMQEDRVDATVIDLMDDASLAVYLPAYGDRLAARRFCLENREGPSTKDCRKHSLLEKLKHKMGIDGKEDSEGTEGYPAPKKKQSHATNNKWARKKTRKIEVGWFHEGKQVRKRKGGGTRTIEVPKETNKADLLQYATDLFFPGGKNKFGRFETFSCDIVDYQEEAILDDGVTVGDLYETLKMSMLRFYLWTKSLPDDEDDTNIEEVYEQGQEDVDMAQDFEDALSNTSEVIVGAIDVQDGYAQLDDTLEWFPSPQHDEVIITFITPPTTITTNNVTVTSAPLTMSTVPQQSCGVEISNVKSVMVKIHRVNILEEMICQFKDSKMLDFPLKYAYIDEKGADAAGISRDVYAAFWNELMEHAAEGEELRVPILQPRWQEEEWKAIARILIKGFKDCGYFPCRLAPVFAVTVIFGEKEVSDDMLLKNLLLYINHSDRDLLTKALKNELSDEEKDDLLDLLDRLNVTSIPTKDNLGGILLRVAHKQLIQKPRYAAEKMSFIASVFFQAAFPSPQDVVLMYEGKKPTAKKFIKLLDASPTTQAESQSLRFLKQYIRGLDNTGLRKLLRFVTGSDVICVEKVEILFTSIDGVARRPVAHTCGPTLELPWTYISYPELRVEIDGILSSESSLMFGFV
ncbi:unnamed protein product [Knipowitschia caucasica]